MVAGFIGGAIWGGIAGWLKARTGAHEVISTIMLNYIALYLLTTCSSAAASRRPGHQAISDPVDGDRPLPAAVRLGALGQPESSSRCSPRWAAGGC